MRIPVLILACCALLPAGALGDAGGSVRSELAYIESTTHFRNGTVVNGAIGGGLQRWKLSTSDLEQHIFTIDGPSLDGPVGREVYIHDPDRSVQSQSQRAGGCARLAQHPDAS